MKYPCNNKQYLHLLTQNPSILIKRYATTYYNDINPELKAFKICSVGKSLQVFRGYLLTPYATKVIGLGNITEIKVITPITTIILGDRDVISKIRLPENPSILYWFIDGLEDLELYKNNISDIKKMLKTAPNVSIKYYNIVLLENNGAQPSLTFNGIKYDKIFKLLNSLDMPLNILSLGGFSTFQHQYISLLPEKSRLITITSTANNLILKDLRVHIENYLYDEETGTLIYNNFLAHIVRKKTIPIDIWLSTGTKTQLLLGTNNPFELDLELLMSYYQNSTLCQKAFSELTPENLSQENTFNVAEEIVVQRKWERQLVDISTEIMDISNLEQRDLLYKKLHATFFNKSKNILLYSQIKLLFTLYFNKDNTLVCPLATNSYIMEAFQQSIADEPKTFLPLINALLPAYEKTLY